MRAEKVFFVGASRYANSITDIAGIEVGHCTDLDAATGCTVILCKGGAVGGVDVRGSAPGTRETDLLRPGNLVEKAHAIVLSGGSAFGLDAAGGVMRYLEEQGIGFAAGGMRVPIVPAAILFDLGLGRADVRPDAAAGYAACLAASDGPVAEGTVGAGTGATLAKGLGRERCLKGGVGSASIHLGDDLVVAALVAVNALGDVIDPETGEVVAAPRSESGDARTETAILEGRRMRAPIGVSTTIGVVATNAALTKEQANKLAQMSQSGLAQALRPAHTMGDGDVMFALATGEWKGEVNVTRLGVAAARVTARAIVRAARLAQGLHGVPAVSELAQK